jgi:hypothetical protein
MDVTYRLLVSLFAAHMLADFVLQSEEGAARKRSASVLLSHCAIQGVAAYVLAGILSAWAIFVAVFLSHMAIDYVKVRVSKLDLKSFCLDQLSHFAVIVVLSVVLSRTGDLSRSILWQNMAGPDYYRVLVIASGFILTVPMGAVVVGLAMRPFLDQLANSNGGGITGPARNGQASRGGFENGGRIIGQLERALIFLLVMVGTPAAVGFLIAAKSIFRFGEVTDKGHRMEAEYIIIGTLTSFAFGMFASYFTRWTLGMF